MDKRLFALLLGPFTIGIEAIAQQPLSLHVPSSLPAWTKPKTHSCTIRYFHPRSTAGEPSGPNKCRVKDGFIACTSVHGTHSGDTVIQGIDLPVSVDTVPQGQAESVQGASAVVAAPPPSPKGPTARYLVRIDGNALSAAFQKHHHPITFKGLRAQVFFGAQVPGDAEIGKVANLPLKGGSLPAEITLAATGPLTTKPTIVFRAQGIYPYVNGPVEHDFPVPEVQCRFP